MTKHGISRTRLIANGIFCLAVVLLCLPVGLLAVIDLVLGSASMTDDPDGAGKVALVQWFAALIGALAFADLIRTVKKLRGLRTK